MWFIQHSMLLCARMRVVPPLNYSHGILKSLAQSCCHPDPDSYSDPHPHSPGSGSARCRPAG